MLQEYLPEHGDKIVQLRGELDPPTSLNRPKRRWSCLTDRSSS